MNAPVPGHPTGAGSSTGIRNGSVSSMVVRAAGEATSVTLFEKDAQFAGWQNAPQLWRAEYDRDDLLRRLKTALRNPCGTGSPDAVFTRYRRSKEVKTIGEIGKDFTPARYNNPGVRLSLSPDGKSILYPATRRSSSLYWMMEGLISQAGWTGCGK